MVDRIASLLPSSTEIVCALGLRERLVGVSHECDYPTDVVGLPVLTEPKLDPRGTSGDIDARVQEIVQEGLSVYRLNTDALQDLKPEVIVTQDQCEVCAVSLPDVEDAVQCFLTPDVKVVSLNPEKLSDIWRDIRNVAAATGRQEIADSLIRGLEERLGNLKDKTRHLPRPARCLPGMARSSDGRRQLDSRTGGLGGRRVRPRRGGGAYAAHYLGYPGRLPAGGDRNHAVRVQNPTVAGGPAAADGASPVAGVAGGASEPGVRGGRQCLLQPARSTHRGKRGNPRRDAASRGLRRHGGVGVVHQSLSRCWQPARTLIGQHHTCHCANDRRAISGRRNSASLNTPLMDQFACGTPFRRS